MSRATVGIISIGLALAAAGAGAEDYLSAELRTKVEDLKASVEAEPSTVATRPGPCRNALGVVERLFPDRALHARQRHLDRVEHTRL